MQNVVAATTIVGVQRCLKKHSEEFTTGVGKQGGRNKRVLKGALGALDEVMNEHALEAEDVMDLHRLLTQADYYWMRICFVIYWKH